MVLFLFTGERDAPPASYFYSLPLRKQQKDGGKSPLIQGPLGMFNIVP